LSVDRYLLALAAVIVLCASFTLAAGAAASIARDPNKIFGLLLATGANPRSSIRSLLRSVAAADLKTLRRRIELANFQQTTFKTHGLESAIGGKLLGSWDTELDDMQDTNSEEPIKLKAIRSPLLHPVTRIIILVLLAGMIISLEVLLQRSLKHQGLGDVKGSDTYTHYLWTTCPAAILSLVAMYIGSVDFQTRLLTPYHAMTIKTPSSSSSIDLDLLSPLLPRLLVREFRTRNFAACTGSLAMLLTSLLATISASLFQVLYFPTEVSLQLEPYSSFGLTDD
jgi:hypothetical protein